MRGFGYTHHHLPLPAMAAGGRMHPEGGPGKDEQSWWLFSPWLPSRITQELFQEASTRKPVSEGRALSLGECKDSPGHLIYGLGREPLAERKGVIPVTHPPPSPLSYQHSTK